MSTKKGNELHNRSAFDVKRFCWITVKKRFNEKDFLLNLTLGVFYSTAFHINGP